MTWRHQFLKCGPRLLFKYLGVVGSHVTKLSTFSPKAENPIFFEIFFLLQSMTFKREVNTTSSISSSSQSRGSSSFGLHANSSSYDRPQLHPRPFLVEKSSLSAFDPTDKVRLLVIGDPGKYILLSFPYLSLPLSLSPYINPYLLLLLTYYF